MLHYYRDGQDCAKAVGLCLAWGAWLYCVAGVLASYLVLPATITTSLILSCPVLSCATTVWFLVVCGMLLSMLHAEGDMVGVLGDALELMEQPVYHFHRS